jgi:hypothetical protein
VQINKDSWQLNTPTTSPNILKAIADNDYLKGAMAIVGVVGTIVSYIKLAAKRAARAKLVADRYEFKGWIFTLIDRVPHRMHLIVAYLTLFGSFVEIGVIADQQALSGSIDKKLPDFLAIPVHFISENFLILFLVAAFLALACHLRWIESVIGGVVGLVPTWRQTLEWPNALWQTENDEDEKPTLAGSAPEIERWTNTLIDDIVGKPRSHYLALRPANVADTNAGNILYFGHVVEEYCSGNLNLSFPWTHFYKAMADVAATPQAPFAPHTIRTWPKGQDFFPVILQVNAGLTAAGIPANGLVPNNAGLEADVRQAFEVLHSKCNGDARNLASGWLGTSYGRLLRRSNCFLAKEEMRRQFAKLVLIWKVIPDANHPKVFRIPFSAGMFLNYVDSDIMLCEGKVFRGESERVQLCFEAVERQIVDRAHILLNESRDATRAVWRHTEKTEVEARNIDWTWWVYYRVDTQAYSNSRGYQPQKWERIGNDLRKK